MSCVAIQTLLVVALLFPFGSADIVTVEECDGKECVVSADSFIQSKTKTIPEVLASAETAEATKVAQAMDLLQQAERRMADVYMTLTNAAQAHEQLETTPPSLTAIESTLLSSRDLERAQKVVPGASFLAAHTGMTNAFLNQHLTRLALGRTKGCEDFSGAELDKLQAQIHAHSSQELKRIHVANKHPTKGADWSDPRAMLEGATIAADVLAALPQAEANIVAHEKGCYDAAMAFTHGISDAAKGKLLGDARFMVPLLPEMAASETNAKVVSLIGYETVAIAPSCILCHNN